MKSWSFLEVESVSQSTLIIIKDKVCSLSTQTATRLTLTFFPTRRERWEITENIMEQFLWLSRKAVYLWRLLNSQAGFFTWLLFERPGGIPLTTQVCLRFLTQGNKRKLTSQAIWFYVYRYIKMKPFSPIFNYRQVLFSHGHSFPHIFQQEAGKRSTGWAERGSPWDTPLCPEVQGVT